MAGIRRSLIRAVLSRPQRSIGGTLATALVVVAIAGSGGSGGSSNSASSGDSSAATEAHGGGASSAAGATAQRDTAPAAKAAPTPQGAIQASPGRPPRRRRRSRPPLRRRRPRRRARSSAPPSCRSRPPPDDVQDTADGVVRETQASGGYVQQSSIATRDGGGEASFTLRIPSTRLDETLGRPVQARARRRAEPVGDRHHRAGRPRPPTSLSAARAERRALLRALGRATTDRQIAGLRARLRDNGREIARSQGRAGRAAASRRPRHGRGDDRGDRLGEAGRRRRRVDPGDALHDAGRVLEVAAGVALIAPRRVAPLAVLAVSALLAGRALPAPPPRDAPWTDACSHAWRP